MTYFEFLERVISDGIVAAQKDYANDPDKLRGSVAGFEACRGLLPLALASLLTIAKTQTQQAYREQADNYWEIRCFEAEVSWIANCVSALLMNEGQPVIYPPTARGVLRAAEILGVRGE